MKSGKLTEPPRLPESPGQAKPRRYKKLLVIVPLVLAAMVLANPGASAASTLESMVESLFGEDAQTVDIIILLTLLSLLPSMVIMLTGFTRIVIVMGFIRNAMGTSNAPPNQVLIGLSLFLTLFVMRPVLSEVYETAYVPYTEGEIGMTEFIDVAAVPMKDWMLRQTYQTDMDLFIELSGEELEAYEDASMLVVIPAFMTSEIKRAFQIGFFIYIPFIVMDMIVASTLMSMGMMMLPPAMISLPFKVLLFVMVDGWQLVAKTLVESFG